MSHSRYFRSPLHQIRLGASQEHDREKLHTRLGRSLRTSWWVVDVLIGSHCLWNVVLSLAKLKYVVTFTTELTNWCSSSIMYSLFFTEKNSVGTFYIGNMLVVSIFFWLAIDDFSFWFSGQELTKEASRLAALRQVAKEKAASYAQENVRFKWKYRKKYVLWFFWFLYFLLDFFLNVLIFSRK